ncbi:MAG TPA: GTP cyclohydrolase FolE2 [Usitatibacter sp.]|nr:GTP cyclohydrolase FolE2 [Usitatibacter sp.]
MNAPLRQLHDVQAELDTRGVALDAAGVKDLRYPVVVSSNGRSLPAVAGFSMSVALDASTRGTHMSRFVELLEGQPMPLDRGAFERMHADMLARLDARAGELSMAFTWFLERVAPVSRARSKVDCEVEWRIRREAGLAPRFEMRVAVAATSLCPCSKAISAYGAHNQRSRVTIDAAVGEGIGIEELVEIAEASASCRVYGLLKRADEKWVTELAYDNPKFAEDLARDVARALDGDPRIGRYSVEVENFESIHNHSAFARVSRGSREGRT